MNLSQLENTIIKAICGLDSSKLNSIDEDAIYSYNYKDEFILEMESEFRKIRNKGIDSLVVQKSECKYCYPFSNAYSFHHPVTDEFIIRYVIHQEKEGVYKIEECRNRPLKFEDVFPDI